MRKHHDKKSAPAKQHGNLGRKLHERKAKDKATFYSPVEIKAPVQVFISSEVKSFLLSMCIEAPESTTNIRSSVFFELVANHETIGTTSIRTR